MPRAMPVVVLALVSAFGCNDGERDPATPSVSREAPPTTQQACPADPPPFRPGYLPAGFSGELRRGAGGGGATDRPAWFHYPGPPGAFIEVVRGEPPFRQSPEDVEDVEVLGRKGTLGPIHEGESVEFRLGPSPCDQFALLGYGVEKEEMRRFAERLASQ